MKARTHHIRRPDQTPTRGRWRICCDCGWEGWVNTVAGVRVLTGKEIERALDEAFVAHLGRGQRRLYLLIDQRQEPAEIIGEDGELSIQIMARGNFIMPEGVACLMPSWHERDGVRWGQYRIEQTGETGELPIGEIRTADNRVFRLDAPA